MWCSSSRFNLKKLHGRKTPLSFRSLEDIFIPSQKIGNKIGWQNLATSRRHTEKLVTIVLLFFVTWNGPQNGPWDCKGQGWWGLGWVSNMSGNGMVFLKKDFLSSWTFWEFQTVAKKSEKLGSNPLFLYGHFWVKKKLSYPVNTGCFWGELGGQKRFDLGPFFF